MSADSNKRMVRTRVALWLLVLVVLLSVASVLAFQLHFSLPAAILTNPVQSANEKSAVKVSKTGAGNNGAVGCLGYIEPQDGVLRVTAPYYQGRSQRVVELKVRAGDQVSAGQVLAILDSREQLEAAVRLAQTRVDLAQARLNQVRAGASDSAIAAQRAVIDEIQASLGNAQTEYRRFEALRRQNDVSVAELDARRLVVETQEHKLREAQERLRTISEVRPTDVNVAQSELSVAMSEEERARLELKTATVLSPANGQVIHISAYPGQEAGPEGLLDLGKTGEMYVEAEVYESDIARVHPRQQATITSDLFDGQLSGVVSRVGATIAKASVLPVDPVSYADARVFKVWIKLDDGRRVAGLIHGKANVVIQP